MVSFARAAELSPFWVRGPLKWFRAFLTKKEQQFRLAFETQSRLSAVAMTYLTVWVNPTLAIEVNIVWSILVAILYWWALQQRALPDLMEHRVEKSVGGWAETLLVGYLIGWKQLSSKAIGSGLTKLLPNGRVGATARKTHAYANVLLFGVTPGYHYLKQEGHSPRTVLIGNCLARIPNAWIQSVEILITAFVIRWLWALA